MSLPIFFKIILWPLSVLYGSIVGLRTWLYQEGVLKQRRLKAKVISVGNLTVGGTGKTPMAIWLAEKFLADGKRVAILSRGYRGSRGKSDEVELMKSRLQDRVLFGVGKDRFAEGRKLEASEPIDVFLLDDGFQHLQLARDADILLIDSSRPLRQEWLLPAGRLRESRRAVQRADVIVFTRVNDQFFVVRAIQEFPQFPIFPACTRLVRYRRIDVDERVRSSNMELPPQPVYAFCGIGNPDAFFGDADRWGNVIAGTDLFRDHHRYTLSDVRAIEDKARNVGARSLLTTEKDALNLGDLRFSSLPVYCCEIQLEVKDSAEFLAALKRKTDVGKGTAA